MIHSLGGFRRLPKTFAITVSLEAYDFVNGMTEQQLDLREIPPPQRHPKAFEAFEELESGASLTLVNAHEPTSEPIKITARAIFGSVYLSKSASVCSAAVWV